MIFDARFPEDLFPPYRVKDYNQRVREGEYIAQHKKVQIIGLAYNCEKILETNLHRCVALGQYFKDYKICVLENNSKDETPKALLNYSNANDNVSCLIETRPKPKFGPLDAERFQYLAGLRNTLLDHIAGSDFDFLVVYDFDIEGGFSYDGVMSSITENKAGVFSNSIIYIKDKRRYYDYITLRIHDPNEEWKYSHDSLSFQRGTRIKQFNSGFGGLAIYQRNAIKNSRYGCEYGCEHVAFNQGVDMWLNPDQIVLYNETNYTK